MQTSDVSKILYRALADAKNDSERSSKYSGLIDFVLDNTHKTYKYILVTAFASKATDGDINPLCLQAGSTLPGAYDARSVCHGVIVKFEMTELGKALGGSNEPFLNKPARFPELSKTNAVRRGNDQEILNALVDGLPLVQTSEDAYDGLVYVMTKLLKSKEANETMTDFDFSSLQGDAVRLAKFINKILNESFEGEALTLSIAGLFELYLSAISDEYYVEVHPVNQSGASSKEISDLDIYKDGQLYVANELKDKAFSEQDVRHAADKVISVGKPQMNFVMGRHGSYDEDEIKECVTEYLQKGFIINVTPVNPFVLTLLLLIEDIDIDRYVRYILQTAIDTKFKEETISFIRNTADEQFGEILVD